MSLHERIEGRRKSDAPAVESDGEPVAAPTLQLLQWKGARWAFPWSHLATAQFVVVDSGESLILSYPGHQVTIAGENLSELWEDLSNFRAPILRELPSEYGPKLAPHTAFITKIEVEVIESTKRDRDNS